MLLRRSVTAAFRVVTVAHLLVVVLCCACHAQSASPERKVTGNVITSEYDPAVRIQFPRSVQYAGADRWVLYGIADCELHAFVQADGEKKVRRLYWVQFEGYLPSRPELKHTYDSPRHANLGGEDFYVDTWVRATGDDVQPGSDVDHIEALIKGHGYKMPAAMMYVRLVHLLDEKKRKELMIIYGEELPAGEPGAAELKPGGKASGRWEALQEGLIRRAKQRLGIHFE